MCKLWHPTPLHCSRVNCAFSDKHNYKNIPKIIAYFFIEIAVDFIKLYCNTYIFNQQDNGFIKFIEIFGYQR